MPVDIERARRLFTAEEFARMDSAGVFRPEERLELIDGEIFEMSPVGPGHGAAIAYLSKRLILGGRSRGRLDSQWRAYRSSFTTAARPGVASSTVVSASQSST